jgi:peptide/nickel transport system substrate-binding protein
MENSANKKFSRRLLGKVAALGAFATGTLGGADSALAQASPPAGSGGTLVFAYAQASSYANTCVPKFYAGVTDVYLRRFMNSELVQSSTNFDDWLPDLAESWEFDGNRATFHLRQGVTWHDGQPFTSKDVLFTYHVIASPMTADTNFYGYNSVAPVIVGAAEFRAGTAETISGITAPDDYTVVFEMTKPFRAPMLALMDTIGIIPEHILSALPEDQWVDDGICKTDYGTGKAIGTGPFRITNYVVDQIVEYEPFEQYWRGKPLLDKLIFRPFTDAQAQNAAIESGEVHIGTITASEYPRFKEMDHIHLLLRPGLAASMFYVNTRNVPQLARQALLIALDRATIAKTIYYDTTTPPPAAIVYERYGVNPDIAPYYAYDPERAKQMIAESGWDPGRKLRILLDQTRPADEPLYALIRSYWEAVGVQSEFQIVGAEYGNTHTKAPWDFDILLSGYGWGVTPDTVRSAFWNPDSNTGVANQEAVDLLDSILIEEDEEKIKAGIWQLQAIAAEQANLLPLVQSPGIWEINNKVQGEILPIYAPWTSNYWGLEKLWVQE